ncbi:4'-phosphopantetheinyl transferase superfamily protein [Sphingomonas sp. RHCKR7]|uniref:4'-phosphopantetheinyl transferase family protein n=1 Tax=Sphingomonas folli TaxID=2862497 RepID=UPI001CA56919|nr:4'-phosphopantetheinyl transferase superfamily protein [Sphingomonas folli]MBW6528621.1 4'-phosphopantetheinyl transferase superfamily protein [Sphingomonas folli]
MAPEPVAIPRQAWDDGVPWPAMPHDIALAGLDLPETAVLGSAEATGVPLPPAIADARPIRRAHYVAGRLCARRALARLGIDHMPSRRDDATADWPEGYAGSISHTAGYAVAVAARRAAYASLGIDVEQPLSAALEADLAPLVLTPAERDRFARHDVVHLVTLAFSIKEAVFKALWPLTRVRFEPEDVELIELGAQGAVTVRLVRSLDRRWTAGACLPGLWRRDVARCLCLAWVARETWMMRSDAAR